LRSRDRRSCGRAGRRGAVVATSLALGPLLGACAARTWRHDGTLVLPGRERLPLRGVELVAAGPAGASGKYDHVELPGWRKLASSA
jgi:hypothetical protein